MQFSGHDSLLLINGVKPPMPPQEIPCLRAAEGQAWLWPAPPVLLDETHAPLPLAARRLNAMAQTWSQAGAPTLSQVSGPWRELNLLQPLHQPADDLGNTLAKLRQAQPQAVIRLHVDLGVGLARQPAVAEMNAWRALAPLFVHLGVHHPAMLTGAAMEWLRALQQGGVPTAAWVMLASGVNDQPESLKTLVLDLLRQGLRPTHALAGHWGGEFGTGVSEAQALALVRGLRGPVSGLAVPQLLWEEGNGQHRLVVPAFITAMDADGVTLTNYQGKDWFYPQEALPLPSL